MKLIAFIALGGALGAVSRYLMSSWITDKFGADFPWGTLSVNLLGSLLFGFLFIYLKELSVSAHTQVLLTVGFLGAFTTFSTFSLEVVNLLIQQRYYPALLNVASSVIVCLIATACGMMAARRLLA